MATALYRPEVPIVLVGMMGVGKSTVGPLLATRLLLPFVDADEEIQKDAELSIGEIWERWGEDHFRAGEKRIIRRLIESGPKVISAGGGAFTDGETRALILERCLSILLEADVATLAQRVRRRRRDRPLLTGKQLVPLLRSLAMARGPYYDQAHLRVAAEPGPPEATVDRILEALEEQAG